MPLSPWFSLAHKKEMPCSSFTCKDHVSCVIKYIDAAVFHARYSLQCMLHIRSDKMTANVIHRTQVNYRKLFIDL